MKTAKETWTIQVQTPSVVTGAIYLNGDWRPFTATTKGTFKFVDGRFKFYFKIAGFIPTGTGSANAAFEIETLNGGFLPIAQ